MISSKWIITGLVLFSLTAWFSEGYHHPDEHFQILEFAQYKLGKSAVSDLAWEYTAQIRPGFQPLLAYCGIRLGAALGLENPFLLAFLLRLVMALLSLALVYRCCRLFPDNQRLVFWAAALLLWFVPYLSVRFSSENAAGLAFMAGMYALMAAGNVSDQRNRAWALRLLVSGFLLGISFCFRYQMGFALLGVGAWLAFFPKKTAGWGGLLWLCLGGVAGLAIGAAADRWLYGEWAFPAYNYFIVNVLENKAAHWGTAPFWYYVVEILLSGVPPVSAIFLGLAIWGGWKNRQHVLVWALLPFLLGHFAVGHKELRFMFPMLLPGLVLALWGWAQLQPVVQGRTWAKYLFGFALGLDLLLLAPRSLLAAQEAVPYFHFLYHYAAQNEGVTKVFALAKNPYNLVGPTARFYQHPNIQVIVTEDVAKEMFDAEVLYLHPKIKYDPQDKGIHAVRAYAYLPEWLLRHNAFGWQDRSRIWSVYKIQDLER